MTGLRGKGETCNSDYIRVWRFVRIRESKAAIQKTGHYCSGFDMLIFSFPEQMVVGFFCPSILAFQIKMVLKSSNYRGYK